MASNSGTLTRNSGQTRDFPWTIAVTEGSPSVANNTSVLSFTATVHSNTTATAWGPNLNNPPQLAIYWHNSNTNTNTLVASETYSGMGAGETKTLNGSLTVTHQSDGSGKGYAYATWTKNASTGYVPNSATLATGEFNLTTIARASSVAWSASSVSVASELGIAVSFSFSAISGLSYTAVVALNGQTLTYNFSSVTGTQTRSVSNDWILTSLNDRTSGLMRVTLTTKSGSTTVGTSTAECSVTINTSSVHPLISIGSISGTFYAGRSSMTIPVTVSNSYGSSGVNVTVSADNGNTVTPASSTSTGTYNFNITTLRASSSGYTLNITARVTDSRGVQYSASKAVSVTGWTEPTASIGSAFRTATDSSTSEDSAGTYVYVTYSTSTFDGNGTVTCTYYRSNGTSGSIASGGHFELAQEQSVRIRLVVTDSTGRQVEDTANVTFAVIPLQLYQSSDGLQVGAGVGATAEANKLNIGIPTFHSQNVVVSEEIKGGYADGNAGVSLHTNGNIVMVSSGFPYLGMMSQNSTSYTVSIHEDSAQHLNMKANNGQTFQTSAGTVLSTTASGYIDLGVTGSSAYVSVKNAGLISQGFVMFGGKTGYYEGHAGGILDSEGNLCLNNANNPQIYMMTNNATSIDDAAQSTNVLRMGAYQKGYNNTWARNAPALYVNGGVCGSQGVFWNGKPCVFAQDSSYTHTYSMSWDGTHLNFYVDGSLKKSI